MPDLTTRIGSLTLRSPLVAASGTVGSVVDFAGVADLSAYGAAVAKSVSAEPWQGRPPPRVAQAAIGMLNGIGIQNPGIGNWLEEFAPRIESVDVPIWGSAVGQSPEEFSLVAQGLESAPVAAIEINLSCPNLDGHMFALDPAASAKVIGSAKDAVRIPVGAKLSPNATDIVPIAAACQEAGADWVTLTNTIWGAGIDVDTWRPLLSGVIGGYSGPPLKPIALRCVIEVRQALPDLPIIGCGGVVSGIDVVEYLLAGANAVALGTVHFAEPKAGRRVLRELQRYCSDHGIATVSELIGGMKSW
jgi:dihydroorotate dehydrogenase (NAD+) catalytic subunit